MLSKLLKHEWKTLWKMPTLMIGILMITAVLAGSVFALPIWESEWIGLPLSGIMIILLFYFAMIVVSVGITVYVAVRFYKSMYTDEGYLTHTLPVTVHQLLQSKLIVMSAWSAIAVLAILVSLAVFGFMTITFVMPAEGYNWADFFLELNELLNSSVMSGWQGFVISLTAMMLVGCISSSVIMTSAITIGQMVRKHRVLGAIGAYFAIITIIQMIASAFMIPFMVRFVKHIEEYEEMGIFSVYTPIYSVMTVVYVITAVGLYFLSIHLVKKQLELE